MGGVRAAVYGGKAPRCRTVCTIPSLLLFYKVRKSFFLILANSTKSFDPSIIDIFNYEIVFFKIIGLTRSESCQAFFVQVAIQGFFG